MDHDDPFDWSIDRVINEICHNQSPSWAVGADIKLVVNPEPIEKALKENDIDGDNLLALEDDNLRIDLGVASFGQRRRLKNIIHQLRSISSKYQTRVRAHSLTSTSLHPFATPQLSHNLFTPTQSSSDYPGLGIRPSIEKIEAKDQGQALDRKNEVGHDPFIHDGARSSQRPTQPVARYSTGDVHAQDNFQVAPELNTLPTGLNKSGIPPQGNATVADRVHQGNAPSQDRVTLGAQNVSILNDLDDVIDQALETNVVPILGNIRNRVPGDGSTRQPGKRKKTTKRAVLIPVQDRNSSVSNLVGIQSQDTDMNMMRIGQPQSVLRENSDESDSDPGPDLKRLKLVQDAYIPHKPFSGIRTPVDSIIRDKASSTDNGALSQEAETKDDVHFDFTFSKAASDMESYQRFRVTRKSKRLVHTALTRVTAVAGKQDKVDPNNLAHTPLGFDHDVQSTHNVPSDLPADLQNLLRKYPAAEEDRLFPLYGDSDVEEKMMTPEWETPPPEERRDTKNVLTQGQIDSIIDRTFEKFRDNWRRCQLPKIQIKAHKKWTAAARNKALHSRMLIECQRWRSRAEKRVVDHRNGIYCSEWRKTEDVEQQCLAVEVSVHQLEEYNLYVNVLENESEPPCPVHSPAKTRQAARSQTVFSNGDEDLRSDSDETSPFVVDDGDDPADLAMNGMPFDEANDTWTPRFNDRSDLEHPRQSVSCGVEACGEAGIAAELKDIPIKTIGETASRAGPSSSAPQIQIIDIDSNDESPSKGKRAKLKKRGASEEAKRNPMSIPRLTDSSEYDSDFERSPRLPPTKFRRGGKSMDKAIDLTRSSSLALSDNNDGNGSDFEVRTPKLSTNTTFELSTRSRVSQEPASSRSNQKQRMDTLVYDVQRVKSMSWIDIEPNSDDQVIDGRLALAKCIYEASSRSNHSLDDFVKSLRTEDDFEDVLQAGMLAVKEDVYEIINIDRKNQHNARYLTELFLSYTLGRNVVEDDDLSESEIDDAYALLSDGVPAFHDLLISLLKTWFQSQSSHTLISGNLRNSSEDIETQDNEDLPGQSHTSKIRKRKVEQSKVAAMQQRADQNRVRRQEEKRAELAKQQAALGLDKDAALIPINTEEPIVYLDRQIGARVKPHQISGIQFMWREIINDPKRQGCLLAHTMGLGKTMQVISLLVTIAQCKISQNPAIRTLIPDHLKGNRIMVICPKSLVENWEEEFAKWVPANPQGHSLVGNVITLTNKIRAPATTIEGWMKTGGILILSYNRFRLYTNPPKNTRVQRDSPEQTRKYLLEGADIVIADEAHQLKNANSKVAQAAHELRTWSRIALTGSPLNNYLEEYHTMINWIAPGYLGTLLQFKAKYVEPISQGLYTDSSSWERKASLKKLHVLKKNIAPKTHRADITAISKDLPPKTEFFITIPLTSDQKNAYQLYVKDLRNMPAADGSKKPNAPRVWDWLGVLSLLLNHPSCFIEKLKQREQAEQSTKAQAGNTENNDDGYESGATNISADDVNLQEQPDLVNAMQKVVDVFTEAKVLYRIEDPSLSNKSLLIHNILEEAVKLGEKTLIFSQSIPTLNYYERMIQGMKLGYKRIDGQRRAGDRFTRQEHVEQFNTTDRYKVFLISTRAGGLGLNIQSATRVIINDFGFNPTWEEQAVGRAYRIGQKKPVYVYRFLTGGTFDELIHNKAVFKSQLFTRVIDEKNVSRIASKSPGEFLFDPKEVVQKNFDECLGKDPQILDRILQRVNCVRNIVLTETFLKDDEEKLTEQELKEADEELELEQLERDNPAEFARRIQAKRAQEAREALEKQKNAAALSQPAHQTTDQPMQAYSHYFSPVVGPPAGYSATSLAHTLSHPAFAAAANGARNAMAGFDDSLVFSGSSIGAGPDPVSALSSRRPSFPQALMPQHTNVSIGSPSPRPTGEVSAATNVSGVDCTGNNNEGETNEDPSSASGCRAQ